MNEILNFLITVRDDREPWKVKHLLSDIVLLVFFARLSGAEYWDDIEVFDHIQSIGRACLHIEKNGQESEESRYFILSCQVSAREFGDYVRGYWQIESLHWLLDVVFREDTNKTLNKQLAFNLNVMDKFCLAVLKRLDFGKKMSLRRKKYTLSLSFDQYLKKII